MFQWMTKHPGLPETRTQGFSGYGQLVTLLLKMKRYMTKKKKKKRKGTWLFIQFMILWFSLRLLLWSMDCLKMCCLISKYLEIFSSFLMSSAIPFWLGNILYMTFNLFQCIETCFVIHHMVWMLHLQEKRMCVLLLLGKEFHKCQLGQVAWQLVRSSTSVVFLLYHLLRMG